MKNNILTRRGIIINTDKTTRTDKITRKSKKNYTISQIAIVNIGIITIQ